MLTEQLCDQTSVRCLSTSCTGTRELKQRLVELGSLYSVVCRHARLLAYVCYQVIEYRLLFCLRLLRNHLDCAYRADSDTLTASHTV